MSDFEEMPSGTAEERIAKALAIAVAYGSVDGSHHKNWTIDQMVRALTGCPVEEIQIKSPHTGDEWSAKVQGKSAEYENLVADAKAGENGPDTYEWDEGIPP